MFCFVRLLLRFAIVSTSVLLSSSRVRSEQESVCVRGPGLLTAATAYSSVRGSVLQDRGRKGIQACAGYYGMVRLLLLLRFVGTCRCVCGVRVGPVRFVVVVVVAPGTVGMGISACAGSGKVLLVLFRFPSRPVRFLCLLLLVPLYYSFRFNYPSCSCSSFRLLLTLLLVSTIIGITIIIHHPI